MEQDVLWDFEAIFSLLNQRALGNQSAEIYMTAHLLAYQRNFNVQCRLRRNSERFISHFKK
jgi:hypothetical protein